MELSRECLHRSEAAQLLKRIMLFQSERAVNNKTGEEALEWLTVLSVIYAITVLSGLFHVCAGEV